jgi:hypothetical protein
LQKTEAEKLPEDHWKLHDKFRDYWGVLVDKGYQGLADECRAIHPKKRPPRGFLDRDDEEFNRKQRSDRVLVENYFGRMCSLWMITSRQYRWTESRYDMVMTICAALTNFHVSTEPLREQDMSYYKDVLSHLSDIGNERFTKKRQNQQKYREKKKCMEHAIAALCNDDDDDDDCTQPND